MKARLLLPVGLASVFLVSVFVFFAAPVNASPNDAPDADFFRRATTYGNSYGTNVPYNYMYAVSRDDFTNISNSHIKIYMPTPTGTIRIVDANVCVDAGRPLTGASGGNPAYYRNYDQYYGTRGTGEAVRYTVRNTNGTAVGGAGDGSRYGHWDGVSDCQTKTRDFAVSGSSIDPATGMYPYFLEATALANGKYVNLFRVAAPAGSYVTQDVSDSAQSFGIQQSSPIPQGNNPLVANPPDPFRNYGTMEIPFAADCSVTTPTVNEYIEVYDDDNRNNFDVQPRPFWIRMHEYRRSDNAYMGGLRPTAVQWTTASGWGPLRTSPTTDSNGGWIAQENGGNIYEEVYTTANERSFRMHYTFREDRIYRLVIYNVYYDNTLQFQIPFESVFYYRECQLNSARLIAGMSVNPVRIGIGESASFTPSITATDYQSNTTVNCQIERQLIAPDGGTSSLGAQACVTTGGNANIVITSNGTLTLRSNSYTAPNNITPGSRVCDTITITTPSEDSYFAQPGHRTATSCVEIVGRPYVSAVGGDVWAGARFEDGVDGCFNIDPRLAAVRSWVHSGAGAVSEFGLYALGPIVGFGSGNSPGGNGMTFANTPDNGNLGASTRCLPNYAERVGDDGSLWTGIGAIQENGGKQKFYSGDNTNVTINGGTVPRGSHSVLVVDGDVTITGNINYPGTYNSRTAVPTLWIIAKGNINIQENVTEISGFFVAQGRNGNPGRLQTCVRTGQSVTHNPLTTQVCGNGLDIFGAVMADQFFWQRTRGSAAPGQTYAERVRFDPGLYLNSPLTTGENNLTTQNSRELPPIY